MPALTEGKVESMGPDADTQTDVMVGSKLFGLFLFSSVKQEAQALRCLNLGELEEQFEERGELKSLTSFSGMVARSGKCVVIVEHSH